jgi:hypothetical protein
MEPSMLCNTQGPVRQTAASEVLELAGDIERMAALVLINSGLDRLEL